MPLNMPPNLPLNMSRTSLIFLLVAAALHAADGDPIVVKAGTKIPLMLKNSIDTKHSREGDRVYLETLFPIVVDNHIVIPKGSYVAGTITISKPAGTTKKGELYIRFDSLTLPNGTTRDFRSRLSNADNVNGKVDRDEGVITGQRDKGDVAKTTAEGAGIGAGVGGIAGSVAGHSVAGLGVGAAAGAATGLAAVLLRHKPDAALPQGTTIEMLLDRDLSYQESELPHQ
jgi:type IV secretion system protein VirB10